MFFILKAVFRLLASAITILLVLLICGGCSSKGDEESWDVNHLISFGNTPKVSPDGQKIAFWGNNGESYGIWIYSFGGEVELLWEGYSNYDYTWSPASDKIAFSDPSGNFRSLWVIDLNGDGEVIAENARNPSWSPDGLYIAYQDGAGIGIYLVSSLGGTPSLVNSFGEKPQYSPDGESIAFVSGTGSQQFIYIWDVDTGNSAQLIGGGPNFDWSPDASVMVYDIFEEYNNATTTHIKTTNIVNPFGVVIWSGGTDPSFSPDGNLIVFRSLSGFSQGGIFVISSDGGAADMVSSAGVRPSFCGDNNTIVFSLEDNGIWIAEKN